MSSIIPDNWKIQKLLPILKPYKNPEEVSYRPIAMSSCLAKIAEHLVKNRLEWFAGHTNVLSPYQFGFRKGRSVTLTCIH